MDDQKKDLINNLQKKIDYLQEQLKQRENILSSLLEELYYFDYNCAAQELPLTEVLLNVSAIEKKYKDMQLSIIDIEV